MFFTKAQQTEGNIMCGRLVVPEFAYYRKYISIDIIR